MGKEKIYSLKSVKKSYKEKEVLQGIDLDIYKGEIITIIGKNGAGKSTMLKNMMGLIEHDSGCIKFERKEISEYKNSLYKYLGVILEGQNNLYSYISAEENIYYYGSLIGISKKQLKVKSINLLKEFGLYEDRKKNVGDFSTGMKQKLGIIVALLGNPKVLFLDEPTLGLDLLTTKELIKKLKKLAKEDGKTIVLTSHEVATVDEISDRIAYLKDGKINFILGVEEFKNKFSEGKKVIKVRSLRNLNKLSYLKELKIETKNDIYFIYLDENNKNNDSNRVIKKLIEDECEILEFSFEKNQLEDAILNISKEER